MHKLRERQGETLTETLCALLVLALAVALLAAMISGASRLDRKTDQAVSKLYQTFSEAEKQDGTSAVGKVSVQIGDDPAIEVTVNFYGDPGQMVSYRIQPEGGAP